METPLIALEGGGNNRVYRVSGLRQDYVLKRYFPSPENSFDRFKAERMFYDFLWNCGLRQIPKPHAWDEEHRLGLFTFVVGRKLEEKELTTELVGQALQFITQINSFKEQTMARAISAASDAYFSVSEQVNSVSLRVAALNQIEPSTELDAQAVAFARDELLPAWQETAAEVLRRCQSDPAFNQTLSPARRCLSPADFGFHNALLDGSGRLHFIDFEYAGWDDPAKVICDFFCQPQVPVDFEFWELFTNSFAASLHGEDSIPSRAKFLLPIHQIKWCCIVMNHFVKGGKARRDFARGAGAEQAKAGQLSKARRLLQRIHKLHD